MKAALSRPSAARWLWAQSEGSGALASSTTPSPGPPVYRFCCFRAPTMPPSWRFRAPLCWRAFCVNPSSLSSPRPSRPAAAGSRHRHPSPASPITTIGLPATPSPCPIRPTTGNMPWPPCFSCFRSGRSRFIATPSCATSGPAGMSICGRTRILSRWSSCSAKPISRAISSSASGPSPCLCCSRRLL